VAGNTVASRRNRSRFIFDFSSIFITFLNSWMESINFEDDPSPFGPLPVDLKNQKLKVSDKEWLGRQVIKKTLPAFKAAIRYNLNRKTITKWACLVRKRLKIYTNSGRPSLIKSEKLFEAANAVENFDASNMDQLNAVIKKALYLTMNISQNNLVINSNKRLCQRTMHRYREKLRNLS
jgi:hypothetical protein